jgi:hypothetical protein
MAEVEYGGIKVSGGKLLLILPLVGTLGGGLWAGFEFYKDYMTMKEQISNYVSPDLSHIENKIAVLDATVNKDVIAIMKVVEGIEREVSEVRLEIRGDLAVVYDNMDLQDKRNRENVKTVRDIISGFEVRVGNKMDRLDEKIDTLETELDQKIKRALDNPLANGG